MRLSRVAQGAKPSATLSINAEAKRMKKQGLDVVTLTVGEPDFDTPDNIKQAAIRAIQSGYTKYTAAPGTPEIRRAVADKLTRDNGLDYKPDQILVSNGTKQALYMIMLCLLEEGDEVLLPAPYWVSYADQAEVCRARPVAVDGTGSADLKITPEMLRSAITERSRLLVLNSPCNPSGVVYTEKELRAIVDVALEHDLWIFSDEVYEKLIYDGLIHASPAAFSEEAYRHTITFNGLSKSHAMTGWRMGYAAGPIEVIRAASNLQSNLTGGPNSITQRAAIEALEGEQGSVAEMRAAFAERRELIVDGLNEIPGVRCLMPQGAFYAFPDCRELMGRTYAGKKVDGSVALSEALLDVVKLAGIPGAPFGAEGYLRFSYAVSQDDIRRALERFAEFVALAAD